MRWTSIRIAVATAILLTVGHDSQAQRGGRGGGGVRGGAVAGTYSGGSAATRSAGTVVGPAGGTRTVASGSGSVTTKGGATVDYAGAGRGGTTPGGVDYGRGVGGVQVTTPGGKQVTKIGAAGGAAGPGGNAVGGRAGATTASGPSGSISSAYRGDVAVGPQGAAAVGGRAGTATGPYGAATAGGAVARGSGGTSYRSAAAISSQGSTVRQNFRNFAQENPVLAARWAGPTWRPIAWGAIAGYAGYSVSEPVYYDYGETVVYQGDAVTVNGEPVGTVEQYTQQATEIANAGAGTKSDPKTGEWQPLGVFAMVGEGEEKSNNIFQLAINKEGVISGEYYNALTDETSPVRGSVDKKTQRTAWNVGDKKYPVYEAGIANLTKDETTMLVHFSKEKSQQFALVRLPPPEDEKPKGGK